jgi:hypothetical protein
MAVTDSLPSTLSGSSDLPGANQPWCRVKISIVIHHQIIPAVGGFIQSVAPQVDPPGILVQATGDGFQQRFLATPEECGQQVLFRFTFLYL